MKARFFIAGAFALAVGACAHHEPPPPPPPPPPPVEAPWGPVTVYFDYGKANLTATAVDAVDDFISRHHHTPHHATVVGYCDTAEYHCHELALHRADAVKGELIRRGMDAGAIATDASDDLSVKTGPHTREPQNRRAVIDPR
jgi:outer membrane protein OmpA-like peptidoglycan-associated protein